MNKLAEHREPGVFTSSDARWALVRRIAESPQFHKSAKLREFLYYVARCVLQGRPEAINEQQIGCRVFGRSPDFHAGEDSIVRVQARLLRKKLEEYFAEAGRDESMVISIPKGTYVPVFSARAAGEAGTAEQAPVESGRRRALVPALIAAGVVVGALLGLWGRTGDDPQHKTAARTRNPIIAALVDSKHQTLMVVQDTGLVLLRSGLREAAPLEGYRSEAYPKMIEKSKKSRDLVVLLQNIESRQYTSYADVTLTAKLFQMHPELSDRISIRHPKHLHIRDFMGNHVILMGGKGANPWIELFEDRMNFLMEAGGFRNRAPREGEPAFYGMYPRDGDPRRTAFAHIAFLPNLDRTGNVLILAGTGMEGTEAAGEFITRPDLPAAIADPAGRPSHFEIILRCTRMDGAPRQSEIVAWRSYPRQ